MSVNASGFTDQAELIEAKVAQQLDAPASGDPQVSSVAIKAKKENKGPLFIGFSKVEVEKEEKVSGAGFELAPGEAIELDTQSIGNIWFNGANAKDGLCVFGVGP